MFQIQIDYPPLSPSPSLPLSSQVIIVQFGGRPFNTAALTLDQWMWCILLGVGVLVWGQLITTIPTKRIPKQFSWGSGPPEDVMDATSSLVEDGSSGSLSQDVKRTGQILWIRGLTRLQTQVCLIQLHNSTVSQQLSLKRQSLGSPTSPTSLAAAAVAAGSGASGQASGSDSGVPFGSQSNPLVVANPTHAAQTTHHRTLPSTQTPSRPDTIEEVPELPGAIASDSPAHSTTNKADTHTTPSTTNDPLGSGASVPPVLSNNHNHNSVNHSQDPCGPSEVKGEAELAGQEPDMR